MTPDRKTRLSLVEGFAYESSWAFVLREPQIGGSVVDILVRPEVSFEILRANAVTGALFSRHVWIASIDDLLVMKRSANRPKDQLYIVALEKIKRGEDPNV